MSSSSNELNKYTYTNLCGVLINFNAILTIVLLQLPKFVKTRNRVAKNTNILAKCERQESDLNPFSPLTNRLRVTFPKMHFRLSCTLFDVRQDPLPPFKINSGLETSSPLLLLWLGARLAPSDVGQASEGCFRFVCGELSCDIYSGGLWNSGETRGLTLDSVEESCETVLRVHVLKQWGLRQIFAGWSNYKSNVQITQIYSTFRFCTFIISTNVCGTCL